MITTQVEKCKEEKGAHSFHEAFDQLFIGHINNNYNNLDLQEDYGRLNVSVYGDIAESV